MPEDKFIQSKKINYPLTFGDFLKILQRQFKIVLSLLLIILVITVLITLWQKPIYIPKAMIAIEDQNQSISLFNVGIPSSFTNNILNEKELIRSRTLLEDVVREFWNSHQRDSMFLFSTKTYNPDGLRRLARELLTIGLWNPRIPAIIPEHEIISDSLLNVSVSIISENMKIGNPRTSNIIYITYNSYDPNEGASIINAIIELYNRKEQVWSSSESSHMIEFLENHLENLDNELKDVEDRLKRFQEAEKVFGLEDEAAILMRALASIEVDYYIMLTRINIAKERKRYMLSEISKSDTSLASKLINSVNNKLYALRQEIAISEADLVRNSSIYSENHEAVLSTSEKIKRLKNQLVFQTNILVEQGLSVSNPLKYRRALVDSIVTADGTIFGLEGAASEYKNLVDQYSDQLHDLPGKSLHYLRLERERFVVSETYKFLRQKLEESRVNEASQFNKIRIVDRAIPVYKPSKPKLRTNLLIGLMIGIVFGIFGALWRENWGLMPHVDDQ